MRWGGGGPPALDAEDTPFLGPGGLAGCGRASSFESEIRGKVRSHWEAAGGSGLTTAF